jgi:hypothetical protein
LSAEAGWLPAGYVQFNASRRESNADLRVQKGGGLQPSLQASSCVLQLIEHWASAPGSGRTPGVDVPSDAVAEFAAVQPLWHSPAELAQLIWQLVKA